MGIVGEEKYEVSTRGLPEVPPRVALFTRVKVGRGVGVGDFWVRVLGGFSKAHAGAGERWTCG